MNGLSTANGEVARRVSHFVHGARRLAITSRSLAELLGLAEEECRAALEAMAARGLLRKDSRHGHAPLYCKGKQVMSDGR